MHKRNYLYIGLFFVVLIAVFLEACSNSSKKDTSNANLSGKELAAMYCVTCHVQPSPEHLTKELWKEHVLPRMGYFLGFYPNAEFRETLFEKNEGGKKVEQAGVYPIKPVISQDDWDKIQAYFIESSPDSFTIKQDVIAKTNPFFETVFPPTKYSPPSTTHIKFASNGGFYFGDAHSKQFLQLNPDYSIKIAAELEEGAVWSQVDNGFIYVTVMGSFAPTDNPLGMIVKLPESGNAGASIVLDNLQRPVHSLYEDIDGDGIKDFVVCEFGKFTGGLNWYKGGKDGKYTKNVLWTKPGAIRTYFVDMNKDGKKDIVALFAQADEGVDIYFNQGKGNFERARVLAFPPSYGSCAFHLQDYDKDGYQDIVYVSGDNADFKPILRPYHGIYVFKNNQHNGFEQTFFYPLNGAYDAVLNDFDKDGDMDIAAISFFPDWLNHPEQGFVFLENTGNMKMNAYSFDFVSSGRWIVMDVKDYDNDGDSDIVLGSLVMEVQPETGIEAKWIKDALPFIVLKNKKP